ncbi:hypothetical protein ACGVWS_13350 [Enterobacteriaceae bacterium LUAb1]
MTDKDIERLVERVLQRWHSPVLVMVSAARGYRHAIRSRLAACDQRLHIVLDEDVTDGEQWQAIGKTLATDVWQDTLSLTSYRALVLPFLDYSLAAELVNGTLHSPAARRLHDALLAGLPVLALRYHCDPLSELNQLYGAAPHSAYVGHMQSILTQLATCGVVLCTMNELLKKLTSGVEAPVPIGKSHRYITVTDLESNPALASSPGRTLTDAAVDFLKNKK